MALKLRWADEPEAHDYQDARDFLALAYSDDVGDVAVQKLRKASISLLQPSDILRAADLKALPLDDAEVQRLLTRAKNGVLLSPVLLVHLKKGGIDVANGYHHLSLAQHVDSIAPVKAKVVKIKAK